MKIIAFYLPQFHTFPENDKWWGKGFTEWQTVKNAQKIFKKHNQPRVPLNNNYYCLNDNGETLQWQCKLARDNGIYGFAFYHYWFDGKLLMERPMEILLEQKDIDINYCVCWANENWTRAWADKSKEILIEQTYGDSSDWVKHFNYLLQFFKDERYILVEGKPLIIIYRPEIIPTRLEMFTLWDKLAKENGFEGLFFLYQQNKYNPSKDKAGSIFKYGIEYQPQCAMDLKRNRLRRIPYNIKSGFNLIGNKFPFLWSKCLAFRFNYDSLWKSILNDFPKKDNMYPGAFVDWDNTPRHKKRGTFCENVTPEKFEKYLSLQIERTKTIYKKDILFLFAWNEWGEGGYLEPDTKNEYKMLTAIKNATKKEN